MNQIEGLYAFGFHLAFQKAQIACAFLVFQTLAVSIYFAGPDLPYSLDGPYMVPSDDGHGVILIGGKHWNGTWDLHSGTYPNEILELRSDANKWKVLPKKLNFPREDFIALAIPSELTTCHDEDI